MFYVKLVLRLRVQFRRIGIRPAANSVQCPNRDFAENEMQPSTVNIVRHINFRPVRPGDAEFILSLRLDKALGRFLSSVDDDPDAQRTWIVAYMERETQGREYYYIIVDETGENIGTVRMYDFRNNSFSWGSWILKTGAPSYGAIESALLVYDIGFNQLGFDGCHFRVRKENERTLAFHIKFGARVTGEDDVNKYFVIDRKACAKARETYSKFLKSA